MKEYIDDDELYKDTQHLLKYIKEEMEVVKLNDLLALLDNAKINAKRKENGQSDLNPSYIG